MTTSMHMWICVCLYSGREPVADPSVLHMASIVVKMLDNQPPSHNVKPPGLTATRETLGFTFYQNLPRRWLGSLQAR